MNGCQRPFGWPNITFDRISRYFRSIRNFFFSQNGCQRQFWMTENHVLIAFLAISDQYATLIFFSQYGCRRPFWMTDIAFDHISRHFRSIRNFDLLNFVHKMAVGGHFGWPKIPFECISRHFRSKRSFWFLIFCFKMAAGGHFGSPIWAILDDRKSLSIAFLAISDQYTTFCLDVFFKMATSGHFGSSICAKNNRVLPLCVINGYAKYEVDRWIYDTVRGATSFFSMSIQNGRQRPFCFFRLMPKIIGFL